MRDAHSETNSCEVCEEEFVEKEALKKHMNAEHPAEPWPKSDGLVRWICQLCHHQFDTLHGLGCHQVQRCRSGFQPGEGRWACQDCQKDFRTIQALQHHRKEEMHSSYVQLKCECGATYNETKDFLKHVDMCSEIMMNESLCL